MNVVLWDTRRTNCRNPFLAFRQRRWFSRSGFQPGESTDDFYWVDSTFAYLAAACRIHGMSVKYCVDVAPAADLFIFVPTLKTFAVEFDMIRSLKAARPKIKIWVTGPVAAQYIRVFDSLNVKTIQGDPRALIFNWQQIATSPATEIHSEFGSLHDLTDVYPDWDVVKSPVSNHQRELIKTPGSLLRIEESDSAEFLIEQMERSHWVYGINRFRLVDRRLDECNQRFDEFLSRLSSRDLKVPFSCLLSPEVTTGQLKYLAEHRLQAVTLFVQGKSNSRNFNDRCRNLDLKTQAIFPLHLHQIKDRGEEVFRFANTLQANKSFLKIDGIPFRNLIRTTPELCHYSAVYDFDHRQTARNIQRLNEWSTNTFLSLKRLRLAKKLSNKLTHHHSRNRRIAG